MTLDAFLRGDIEAFQAKRPATAAKAHPRIIFPGSFNPLHKGHRLMASYAAARYGRPVEFEISIVNVEKPTIATAELQSRLAQFGDNDAVWITRAETFAKKATVFGESIFVIGLDTLVRIGNAAFYYGEAQKRDAAIDAIANLGCRFLVFGRLADKQFLTLADCELPGRLAGICDAVSETDFRVDLSSSELRG